MKIFHECLPRGAIANMGTLRLITHVSALESMHLTSAWAGRHNADSTWMVTNRNAVGASIHDARRISPSAARTYFLESSLLLD